MKPTMITIGNFLFKFRNKIFPLIVVAIFLLAVPPRDLFGIEALEEGKDVIALLIACAGLVLRALVIGYAYIKRGGLNKKVYAENLVTDGIFQLSRNPLYLGNLLIYAGVFLMHGNLVVMLLGMTIYVFAYYCIVFAEEAYLEQKFGMGYEAYCRDVPRWFPKLSRFGEATQDMAFNLRRVIVKDYTTAFATIIMLTLTEGYEVLGGPHPFSHPVHLAVLASFVVGSGVVVAIISRLKKMKLLTENAEHDRAAWRTAA